MTVPVYLPYYVLVGSVAITVAILVGLRRALTIDTAHGPPHPPVAVRQSRGMTALKITGQSRCRRKEPSGICRSYRRAQ